MSTADPFLPGSSDPVEERVVEPQDLGPEEGTGPDVYEGQAEPEPEPSFDQPNEFRTPAGEAVDPARDSDA